MNDTLRTAYLGRYDPLVIPILLDMLRDEGIYSTTKLPHDQPARGEYAMFSSGADQVLVDASRLDEARRLVDERLPQILAEMSSGLDAEFGPEPEFEPGPEPDGRTP
ncbi:MAG TPA: hypothetical protein VM841_03460 [Actinomycetota bacterium]|nr:hypothetical protein [Actinomycetota bacterium]